MRAKAGSLLFQGGYYLLYLTFNYPKILLLKLIHGFRHIQQKKSPTKQKNTPKTTKGNKAYPSKNVANEEIPPWSR